MTRRIQEVKVLEINLELRPERQIPAPCAEVIIYFIMHTIFIEKYEGQFIVRCVGSYADLVQGRNTDYEFSERFKTLKKARIYAEITKFNITVDYQKKGKTAHVSIVEKLKPDGILTKMLKKLMKEYEKLCKTSYD